MAVIELSAVVGAIIKVSASPLARNLNRQELVIKILKFLKLNEIPPADDFLAIYAYSLVEYGVYKPKPILDFFRHEFIRNAFEKSFAALDYSILNSETENFVDWNNVGSDLRKLDIDPRKEFSRFTAVFNEVVDRTRTASEIKRDHVLADLHNSVNTIIEKLEITESLDEILAEVTRLNLNYQSRRFMLYCSASGENGIFGIKNKTLS